MTSLPEHLQGDGPCSNCGTLDNIIWFTESVFWNAVVRTEPRLTDQTEILCIPCFVIMADQRGYRCNWRLLPEWHWETKAEVELRRRPEPPTRAQIEQALRECGIGSYQTIIADAVLALIGGDTEAAGGP